MPLVKKSLEIRLPTAQDFNSAYNDYLIPNKPSSIGFSSLFDSKFDPFALTYGELVYGARTVGHVVAVYWIAKFLALAGSTWWVYRTRVKEWKEIKRKRIEVEKNQ